MKAFRGYLQSSVSKTGSGHESFQGMKENAVKLTYLKSFKIKC